MVKLRWTKCAGQITLDKVRWQNYAGQIALAKLRFELVNIKTF
jgi:hypothetical protein